MKVYNEEVCGMIDTETLKSFAVIGGHINYNYKDGSDEAWDLGSHEKAVAWADKMAEAMLEEQKWNN